STFVLSPHPIALLFPYTTLFRSNYWRPAFVLWLIVNYRLFGLGSTLGWHLGNVLLHTAVVLLAFRLLRLLRLSTPVALAIGLLLDRKSTRLNSSHEWISYAVFCL